MESDTVKVSPIISTLKGAKINDNLEDIDEDLKNIQTCQIESCFPVNTKTYHIDGCFPFNTQPYHLC